MIRIDAQRFGDERSALRIQGALSMQQLRLHSPPRDPHSLPFVRRASERQQSPEETAAVAGSLLRAEPELRYLAGWRGRAPPTRELLGTCDLADRCRRWPCFAATESIGDFAGARRSFRLADERVCPAEQSPAVRIRRDSFQLRFESADGIGEITSVAGAARHTLHSCI